jgi:hypothetical protein
MKLIPIAAGAILVAIVLAIPAAIYPPHITEHQRHVNYFVALAVIAAIALLFAMAGRMKGRLARRAQ